MLPQPPLHPQVPTPLMECKRLTSDKTDSEAQRGEGGCPPPQSRTSRSLGRSTGLCTSGSIPAQSPWSRPGGYWLVPSRMDGTGCRPPSRQVGLGQRSLSNTRVTNCLFSQCYRFCLLALYACMRQSHSNLVCSRACCF